MLVHRPGEIGRNDAQATHVADEAAARATETGKVAVAVSLTNSVEGIEEFEMWRIVRDGPKPAAGHRLNRHG